MKHKPYHLRGNKELRWSLDFECFVRVEDAPHWMCFPKHFYLGERWVYLTPGFDSYSANFRGNLSDAWPCIDFGKDLVKALDWLHEAKRRKRSTKKLWVKDSGLSIRRIT